MSNSKQLSKTIKENRIASNESFTQQERVESAMEASIQELRKRHKRIYFLHSKNLLKTEIRQNICDLNIEFGKNISNPNSNIKPDGGILYAYFNNVLKMIVACEAKKQGTNDLRRGKYLKEQPMGNAIERMSKNYLELNQYLSEEEIFPYLIFISGDDFKKASSLRDRITANNFQCSFNKLHIYKKEAGEISGSIQYKSIPSIFVREKQWGVIEIRNQLLKASEISIKHYLKDC